MVRFLVPLSVATMVVAPGLPAMAQAVALSGDAVSLALRMDARTPMTPAVESQAVLDAILPGLKANLQMSLQAGNNGVQQPDRMFPLPLSPIPARSWDSRRVGVNAAWTPFGGAKVELSASDRSDGAFSQRDPYALGSADHATRSRQDQAAASVTFDGLVPGQLRVATQTTLQVEDQIDLSGGTVPTTLVSSGRSADAAWLLTPGHWLKLQGGAAFEGLGVSWRGAQAGSGSYRYLRPRLSGTIMPWSGGQWTLSLERVVSPPNAAAFASFVQAADRPAAAAFEPDHEWRYRASLQQMFAGGASMTASYTRSTLQSVTELGPAGPVQAPMSIGGGERQQVDVSLGTPLSLWLLPTTDLAGRATWRASEVTDPFTGARRPTSGEAAYQGELGLNQALASGRLRWGLNGQVVGASRLYQMSQITALSPMAGVGGYVAFAPGPFVVRLQLDNIIGGERTVTDAFFIGSRAAEAADRINRTRILDRKAGLSVSKSF